MKLQDLIPGQILVADDGFDCMESGPKTVYKNDKGEFYVQCGRGKHYLSGQTEKDGTLVGFVGFAKE